MQRWEERRDATPLSTDLRIPIMMCVPHFTHTNSMRIYTYICVYMYTYIKKLKQSRFNHSVICICFKTSCCNSWRDGFFVTAISHKLWLSMGLLTIMHQDVIKVFRAQVGPWKPSQTRLSYPFPEFQLKRQLKIRENRFIQRGPHWAEEVNLGNL